MKLWVNEGLRLWAQAQKIGFILAQKPRLEKGNLEMKMSEHFKILIKKVKKPKKTEAASREN